MNSFLETSKLTWDASRDLGPYLLVLEKARWGARVADGIKAIRILGGVPTTSEREVMATLGLSIFKMLKGA